MGFQLYVENWRGNTVSIKKYMQSIMKSLFLITYSSFSVYRKWPQYKLNNAYIYNCLNFNYSNMEHESFSDTLFSWL